MAELDNGATIPDALRMTASYWEDAPRADDWQKDSDAWRVRLSMDGRRMMIPFFMGSGHNGKAPTLPDILDALVSDASSVSNGETFEDWASDYGLDTDSRKAERTYRACVRQTAALRRVLGESFAALVFPSDVTS